MYLLNIEKSRERKRRDAQRNAEKKREYKRAYYVANLAFRRAAIKAYDSANPNVRRAISASRRARKLGAAGVYTSDDIKRLFDLQRGRCACCAGSIVDRYHVDHVYPLSKGGSNESKNIQLLCPECNLRKRAKQPHEFMRELGYLI